jgi:hypothetical protein
VEAIKTVAKKKHIRNYKIDLPINKDAAEVEVFVIAE